MRLSPAEFAARRHLLGLTLEQTAAALPSRRTGSPVNPRTVRAWESGRDPIPEHITAALEELIVCHDALVDRMLASEVPIAIPRRGDLDGNAMPGGWYIAAAARAVAVNPLLEVEWNSVS